MLDIMNLTKRLSSLLPLPSFLFVGLLMITSSSASCGSDQACFYFTKVEYDIDNKCPSREEALTFFRGDFCSTPVTGVTSDGRFDGSTCCYDVTESNDFFDCGVGPVPPPEPGTTSGFAVTSSSGVAGAGGVGGAGGAGGNGGSGTCAGCAEFLTNTNPPMLCTASIPIYETYSDCMCNGPCAMACTDTCKTQASSMACETCLIDTTNGCGKEQQACLNDN